MGWANYNSIKNTKSFDIPNSPTNSDPTSLNVFHFQLLPLLLLAEMRWQLPFRKLKVKTEQSDLVKMLWKIFFATEAKWAGYARANILGKGQEPILEGGYMKGAAVGYVAAMKANIRLGSEETKGREAKSCLGWVLNYKLSCFLV